MVNKNLPPSVKGNVLLPKQDPASDVGSFLNYWCPNNIFCPFNRVTFSKKETFPRQSTPSLKSIIIIYQYVLSLLEQNITPAKNMFQTAPRF